MVRQRDASSGMMQHLPRARDHTTLIDEPFDDFALNRCSERSDKLLDDIPFLSPLVSFLDCGLVYISEQLFGALDVVIAAFGELADGDGIVEVRGR